MRNRKNIIIIAMCVAILFMVVVFAALQTRLVVNGTGSIVGSWNIAITNISSVATGAAYNIEDPTYNGTSATFYAGLKKPGDKMTYTITISNNGNIDAVIDEVKAQNLGKNNFTIHTIEGLQENVLLENGKSLSFKIIVEFDSNATYIPEDGGEVIDIDIICVQQMDQDLNGSDVTIDNAVVTTLSGNNALQITDHLPSRLVNYTIKGNSLQNGTPTPDAPIEIQSVGDRTKNLFNIMNISNSLISNEQVVYFDDYSGITLGSKFANGHPIGKLSVLCPELKVGDKFVFNLETNAVRNGVAVNYFYLTTYGKSIKVGTVYECTQEMLDSSVYAYRGEIENAYIKNIQFEISEKVTDYEPYGKYKIPITVSDEANSYNETYNIYLDEPLRKIGSYADYIDFGNQKAVRNVAIRTLDSSLDYTFYKYNDEGLDNTYHFYMSLPEIIKNTNILSNRFIGGNLPMTINETDSFLTSYYGNYIYGQLQKSLIDNYDGVTEKDRFVQFLNEHDTQVFYVPAKPIEQPIELPNIYIPSEIVTVSVNSNGIDVPITIEYYKK